MNQVSLSYYAEVLKRSLKERGLTLTEMERRTGISNAYYSQMISGKRPITEKTWMNILVYGFELSRDIARKVFAIMKIDEGKNLLAYFQEHPFYNMQ